MRMMILASGQMSGCYGHGIDSVEGGSLFFFFLSFVDLWICRVGFLRLRQLAYLLACGLAH